MQVLYLAKKYMLPSLADKCTEYLELNLDASNVFHVLPDTLKYEEKGLVDHCWEVIDDQTDEAVQSDGFVTIEKSLLEELVQRDSLSVREVELFKAVDCWASEECKKQGLAAEGSVKRRILGERVVKAIRFPVMEEKEFADVVLDCDVLTKKELCDMMKHFNSVLTVPVGFAKVKRCSSRQRLSRFGSGSYCKSWHYGADFNGNSDSLLLLSSKSNKLHSVFLFGSENNEYEVTLKMTDSNGVALATKTGKFMSEIIQGESGAYYHGFNIVLKPPVVLEANIRYCIESLITGPPSWYGKGCPLKIVLSGVTFEFYNGTSARTRRTTSERGQFSEFEFTFN